MLSIELINMDRSSGFTSRRMEHRENQASHSVSTCLGLSITEELQSRQFGDASLSVVKKYDAKKLLPVINCLEEGDRESIS